MIADISEQETLLGPLAERVWEDEQGFLVLREDWNDVAGRSSFSSPFLWCDWHAMSWAKFAAGDLHLVCWHSGGELVGVAPLQVVAVGGELHLTFVANVEVSDYLDVVAAPGREAEIAQALVAYLLSSKAPPWDEIALANLPEGNTVWSHFGRLAQEQGWWVEVGLEDICPVIPLPDTYDTYLRSLTKKQRHEVRRKRRRLMEAGHEVRRWAVRGGPELDKALDTFFDLHRRSHPDKAAFMTPHMEAFFRDVAWWAARQGWLHLSFLEIDGRPVATFFCFDYQGRRMVYNSGFDPDTAGHLSPGVNLATMEIEDAIARGMSHLDFLQGQETYKFRLGAIPTSVYNLRVRRCPVC